MKDVAKGTGRRGRASEGYFRQAALRKSGDGSELWTVRLTVKRDEVDSGLFSFSSFPLFYSIRFSNCMLYLSSTHTHTHTHAHTHNTHTPSTTLPKPVGRRTQVSLSPPRFPSRSSLHALCRFHLSRPRLSAFLATVRERERERENTSKERKLCETRPFIAFFYSPSFLSSLSSLSLSSLSLSYP